MHNLFYQEPEHSHHHLLMKFSHLNDVLHRQVMEQTIPLPQNKRTNQADKDNWDYYIKNEQVLEEKYSYCLVFHIISERLKRWI